MLSSDGEAVIALPMKADVDCAVARREVLIATFTHRGQTRLVDNSLSSSASSFTWQPARTPFCNEHQAMYRSEKSGLMLVMSQNTKNPA